MGTARLDSIGSEFQLRQGLVGLGVQLHAGSNTACSVLGSLQWQGPVNYGPQRM